MPVVMLFQSPREVTSKREVVAAITKAVAASYAVAPEQIQVYIHEVDDEDWAKAGVLGVDRPGRPTSADGRDPDAR